MKIKNLFLALQCQGPPKRAFRNFFITGNAWGMFSKNSHINQSTLKPKIAYSTKEKAEKAALHMEQKVGKHFSVYKCVYCDGWHIGKNRENKVTL